MVAAVRRRTDGIALSILGNAIATKRPKIVSTTLLSTYTMPHPVLSMLPLIASAVLVLAGRRLPGTDPIRSAATFELAQQPR